MDFLDGLIGALTDFFNVIGQAIAFLFQLVVGIATFLFNGVVTLAGYTVGGFTSTGSIFQPIGDSFFRGIFSGLLGAIVAAVHWLEDHLRPILDFIKGLLKHLDAIYNRFVKPFIVLLQRVRQVLSILRALHIKWAAKLDQILGTVQHDIQGAFFLLRGVLNSAIDILNILVDPTKLLRRPTLILSLRRSIMALIRQVSGLPPAFFLPSRLAGAPKGLGILGAHFDPTDPAQNPPASFYLGFSFGVPSYDFLGDGETIDDTAVDDVGALDFFGVDPQDISTCADPVQCMIDAITQYMGGS